MGLVMSPRVVLGAPPVDEASGPPLPSSMGDAQIWRTVSRTAAGWEYRLDVDYVTVVQPVGPASSGRYVYVAWVPSDERAGANPTFAELAPALIQAGVLVAWWECAEVDGTLRPQLGTNAASKATRAAWPADWRVRLETDAPDGLPTGPIMIGSVLA